MAQLLTAPLTAKQILAKHGVRESYTDFWNSIKFRKGWESPHIQLSEVEHLLDNAAEIVVRIRSLLDSENPGFKMRMVDGSGREFLWTCEHEQDCPHKEPKRFVRDLVHATFKDANGYVEGLSEEQVDEYMDIIQKSKDSEKSEHQDKILSNLKESWKTTKDLMEEFLDSEVIKDRSNLSWDQVEVIGKGLQRLSENVNEIMGKTQEMETSEVELPSDDEQSESELETPEDGSISEESSSQELELRDPQDLAEELTQSLTKKDEDEPSKVEIEEVKDEAKDDRMEEVKEDKMEEVEEDQVEEEKQTEEEEKRQQEEEQQKEEERRQEKQDKEAASKIQVIAEDVNQLRPGIRSLQEEADNMIPQNLLKSPKASEEALQKLQKKCIYYSEGLMNHLLTLDAVVTSQKSRPLRKEQVNTIQSMMEDIDKIRKKLREFQQTVEPEAEKERKKEEEERKVKEEERKRKEEEEQKLKEERERKRQEEQQRRKEQMEVEEDSEEEEEEEDEESRVQEQKKQRRETELSRSHQHDAGLNWSLLKFEPKMEVSEARDKYVIASFIPGMRKEDIKIQLSKDQQNVTVEGVREPSPKELNQMKRLVLNRIQQDPRYQSGIRKNDMQAMILRAGSGRFGKFSETYRLPPSVDVQNISAQYERGVLEVEIPKIVRRRRQVEPRSPFGRGPSGFFGDNDFWW